MTREQQQARGVKVSSTPLSIAGRRDTQGGASRPKKKGGGHTLLLGKPNKDTGDPTNQHPMPEKGISRKGIYHDGKKGERKRGKKKKRGGGRTTFAP